MSAIKSDSILNPLTGRFVGLMGTTHRSLIRRGIVDKAGDVVDTWNPNEEEQASIDKWKGFATQKKEHRSGVEKRKAERAAKKAAAVPAVKKSRKKAEPAPVHDEESVDMPDEAEHENLMTAYIQKAKAGKSKTVKAKPAVVESESETESEDEDVYV